MVVGIEQASLDSSAYAQAVLNMLEDLMAERVRITAAQPAMLNILEDFNAEKVQLEQGHVAMLNILEDAATEKRQVYDTQHAILNILEDLEEERANFGRLNEELEDRVRQRTSELERSNTNLGTFTYTVAHDLRAPLRGMSGFAAALKEDYGDHLDETGRDYAERICNASVRMGKLIDDLLHLARVSRAEPHREPVDISAMVREMAAELGRQYPDREAEFTIEEGITAAVDSVLIRSVLENLIDNAWKFTSTRDQTRLMFASVTTEPDEIGFYLRDNGVGFDPAHAGKLFQPFQSLHSAEQYPGTGVGLASVQQVVELHGGRIWADSEVDSGATFSIALPRRRANGPSEEQRADTG